MRTANTSAEAQLDIKEGGFWSRGVTAFFDVRVTHVNSASNQNKPTAKIFREQENEKRENICKECWRVNMELLRLLCLERMVDLESNAPYF